MFPGLAFYPAPQSHLLSFTSCPHFMHVACKLRHTKLFRKHDFPPCPSLGSVSIVFLEESAESNFLLETTQTICSPSSRMGEMALPYSSRSYSSPSVSAFTGSSFTYLFICLFPTCLGTPQGRGSALFALVSLEPITWTRLGC